MIDNVMQASVAPRFSRTVPGVPDGPARVATDPDAGVERLNSPLQFYENDVFLIPDPKVASPPGRRGSWHGMGLLRGPGFPTHARLGHGVSSTRRCARSNRCFRTCHRAGPKSLLDPLKDQVRERGLWAAHLPKDMGGNGFGQLPLAQMNLITGRVGVAMEVFGNMAPDSGNAELIAEGGTEEQKDRWLWPNLRGDIRSAFAITEPWVSGTDPTQIESTARARRRRVGAQRPQVDDHQRVDRGLHHLHGGHRSRRATASAVLDDRGGEGHPGLDGPA